ncbi:hypothetical protein J3Q64DRAFT_1847755 [Phycomyces blakesleeanus]|uniref:F-box domain-containing protein n=2 Tax=Phycomyces blakesleeanus TaxID=4837 RepID=A0A162ZXA4_PHYB8|nr:hypothetical protein PHYBLDRAFT_149417 [Phycomyces blakesleeanus NRRL 1555(-)]OAD69631.1 hypothetical protein PHYBLDRAFT_149417 [Phycomyces blakesleeanus NRRL 1555(-)]|eukprot:XP_018287671.1 hypothetical protein PHYBLDRAFT_149417 [Phycomyces blakesleeanus NRRL 1555(-)]
MNRQHMIWLEQASPTESRLLRLPKELILKIMSYVAVDSQTDYPSSLIELSKTSREIYYLIHHDPWRLLTLWRCAFHVRFDTAALYRRRLDRYIDWKAVMNRRFKALYGCRAYAQTRQTSNLQYLDWEVIWEMLTEHDDRNVWLLHYYDVPVAAADAFTHSDGSNHAIILPILSLLVNYDFKLTDALRSSQNSQSQIVCPSLTRMAYHPETDVMQTTDMATTFSPAQDSSSSAYHLFFATIFAHHPTPYQSIPGCVPIPLFPLSSALFDVEYLRRYERNLFVASLSESRCGWQDRPVIGSVENVYASTGFGSQSHYVTEAHRIEGEWIGYYSFQDEGDNDSDNSSTSTISSQPGDWVDGPIRLSLHIVPLDPHVHSSPQQLSSSYLSSSSSSSSSSLLESSSLYLSSPPYCKTSENTTDSLGFPSNHLRTCPLTRFEGTGIDGNGAFTVSGLIDDSEDGQITWEKSYVESEETWEYSGRFVWPMGLCGRWGDEEYGGPWWIWKAASSDSIALPLPVLKPH